ncbi:MAG: hypothetical protein ABI836_12810 [Gemmatimonadota bacterium]
MTTLRYAAGLCLVLLAVAGCSSDSNGPNPPPPGGKSLAAAGGIAQRAPSTTTLPVPFTVIARDSITPIPGVKVYWTVLNGGGSVDVDSSVTGADGKASATFTLGAVVGVQQVLARAPSLNSSDTTKYRVTFSPNSLGGSGPYLMAEVSILPNYGIHDTYVRDGIAFVSAWNEGILIYDVGNGIKGGSPSNPVLIGSTTAGGETHNSWWFHNPNGAKKYLFVGQEGPGSIGTSSSGDIHVLDVSNLANPTEVAFYHMGAPTPAGTHNFWMDEANGILFAAYYNGGVVALDVSGTLSGDLASREIDRFVPQAGSYVWGVQQDNGSIYLSDMVNGLWQLSFDGSTFALAGGGNNVPERFTSDLWIHNGYAYTGTWGNRGVPGNALKVWQLDLNGAPSLVDSVITNAIVTVSDVEVTADGNMVMFGAEGGTSNGFYFYSLADPAHPVSIASYMVPTGIHTATFATIGGRLYAFGAKDPGSPALVVLDVTSLVP